MYIKENISISEHGDDPHGRIVLNVGGMKFESHVATLQNIPDTRLAWLTENIEIEALKAEELFFDRHPGAFIYILNFYRTGKLHIPMEMCGPAFEEELQYWGIDEKQMEPCCWESFTKHREAEENLRSFEGPGFEDLHTPKKRRLSTSSTVGFSKDRCFQWYFRKIWNILDEPHSSKGAKIFSFISCFMIILSVSGYCISTVKLISNSMKTFLSIINYICVVFFTTEFIFRIVTTPNHRGFLTDFSNWIDIISIVPSYLSLVLHKSNTWVNNLVIIRLLRVSKFFKLSYGLQVLLHTLKASSYELTLLILILLIPLVIFSSLVYAIEYSMLEKTKFCSIPESFWWCLITMTTVGYGDLHPETWPGKLIGSICAIFGILLLALPISMIGGNFSLYYAHVRARLKLPQKNRRLLDGNVRGLLRNTKNFSLRDRDRKILKRNNHNAIRLKPDSNLSPTSAKKILLRREYFEELSQKDDGSFLSLSNCDIVAARTKDSRRTEVVQKLRPTENISNPISIKMNSVTTKNGLHSNRVTISSNSNELSNGIINNEAEYFDDDLNNLGNFSDLVSYSVESPAWKREAKSNTDGIINGIAEGENQSTFTPSNKVDILSDSDGKPTIESKVSGSQKTSWGDSSTCSSSLNSLPKYHNLNFYSLSDLTDARTVDEYGKMKLSNLTLSNQLHNDDDVNKKWIAVNDKLEDISTFGRSLTENELKSNRRTSMMLLEKVMSENDVNTIGIDKGEYNQSNLASVKENANWANDCLTSDSKSMLLPTLKPLHLVINHKKKHLTDSELRTCHSTPFLSTENSIEPRRHLLFKSMTYNSRDALNDLHTNYHKESGV